MCTDLKQNLYNVFYLRVKMVLIVSANVKYHMRGLNIERILRCRGFSLTLSPSPQAPIPSYSQIIEENSFIKLIETVEHP
jgi:hypothetical protein